MNFCKNLTFLETLENMQLSVILFHSVLKHCQVQILSFNLQHKSCGDSDQYKN